MSGPDIDKTGATDMGEAQQQHPKIASELALLLVLATLWGASYTFLKIAVATIPPVTLIAGRTLIAGLLLVVIMRWRGIKMPADAANWRRFLFQACLNSVIPWTMVAWGTRALDAGVATILNSTAPIFTFFLTFAITRHEAVTSRKLLGVVAGMVGICLIVGVQALARTGRATGRADRRCCWPQSATPVRRSSAAPSRISIRWRRRRDRCSAAPRS